MIVKNKVHKKTLSSFLLLAITTLSFSGCGKHEAAGGAVGATAGAIIGSSLADNRNKTTGAVLGGIIGNMIGGGAGRVADQEEADERRHEERIRRNHEREILVREAEIRKTRAGLDRWCLSCHRQNYIDGAKRCPACGDTLVREKYCNGCLTVFAATSVYRYCPYCYERQRLIYR